MTMISRNEEILEAAKRINNSLSFIEGANWADKTLINKLYKWLDKYNLTTKFKYEFLQPNSIEV